MAPHQIVLAFCACAVACLAAGLTALRALRLELSKWEFVSLGYVLGSAIVSLLTLGLSLVFLARKGVFIAITLLSLGLLWRMLPWLRRAAPTAWDIIPAWLRWGFACSWIVYGVIYFRHALAPERSPDGGAYHLGFVNLWNHAHGMSHITDMYAAMPQGVEMLFLYAFSIGRHSAAALVHFSFLMLLPVLMLLYGVRFGHTRSTLCAALIVFVTPLVGWDGSVAYNDVALAVAVFAVVYLLQIWRQTHSGGTLIAAGLLAGYCFSIKYTGGLVLFLVAGTVVWELRHKPRVFAMRALLAASVSMAILPLPYLVRNWLWYENPIAPFGNAIFRNPNFHVSLEASYIQGMAHWGGVEWREIPKELTLGGPKFPDNLGPMYMLAPAALAGFLWPECRFPLIAAVVVGATYAGNVGARFLILILPLITMVMVFVLSRLPFGAWIIGLLTVAQLVLSWPGLATRTHWGKTPGPNLTSTSWKIALRQQPEDEYLAAQDNSFMARLIETHVPEGETVFALGSGAMQSYTTRFLLDGYHSALSEKGWDLVYGYETSDQDYRWRWVARFPKTKAREVRIFQTASTPEIWSITEIHLLANGKPIPASSQWRWDARPNPWDVDYLFDGREVPRWRSWESPKPGMYVSVRLDPAQPLDGVEVLSGNGPWASSMEPRILDEAGNWLCPVSAKWLGDPPLDMRKPALQVLKGMGIHYVLVGQYSWDAKTFRSAPEHWGMHEMFSTNEATLYRIE
ncbi:MAG: glycosyltransferase family 39 protein [Acidobacteriia bacterium]|nr:glycosyltransferase family 39 protein [Terriglobia bacterium]